MLKHIKLEQVTDGAGTTIHWLIFRRPNGEQHREHNVPDTCDVRAGGDGGWKGRRLNGRCALKGKNLACFGSKLDGAPVALDMPTHGTVWSWRKRNVHGDLASLAAISADICDRSREVEKINDHTDR